MVKRYGAYLATIYDMTDLAILFRFCSKVLSAESKQVIQGYLGGSNRLITYLDYAHPPTDVLESKPEAAHLPINIRPLSPLLLLETSLPTSLRVCNL